MMTLLGVIVFLLGLVVGGIGLLFIIAGINDLFDEGPGMCIFGFFLIIVSVFIFKGSSALFDSRDVVKESEIIHTYKLKQLESGAVFNFTDTTDLLEIKDTVWINMDTKQWVEPIDTNGMTKCVVLKKLK